MDLRSSKEKTQAYIEHIRLQNLIKQTKVHEGEPETSSSTDIKENGLPITKSQIMERVDQIRKRLNMENKAEREMAQKKFEWERKKRRQGFKSESARADKKKGHAADPSGQAGGREGEEEESEAIRRALVSGKSGAWAAAIEVFLRDAQLVATAESELQKDFEKRRWDNSGADNQIQWQSRAISEDGRWAKRTRSPEPSHPIRHQSRSPEPRGPHVEHRRYRSRPSYGKTFK